MTYALLKAYTLAGVDGDDPRVQAAVRWISGHWTVEVNPGADPALGENAPYQGLFYYYTVMAQALAAAGKDGNGAAAQPSGVPKQAWGEASVEPTQRPSPAKASGGEDTEMQDLLARVSDEVHR